MDERLRQEYLQALGLQVYFPRTILPGAAPSRHLDFPIEPELQIKPETKEQSSPKRVIALDKSTLVDSKAKPEPQPEALIADTETVAPAPVPVTREVRFHLALIRLNADLLALALLPHAQEHKGLNTAQKRLFKNICLGLKLPTEELDFSIKAFHWPFSEAVHLDKSEGAAGAALFTYLSQLQEESEFSRILLMGANIVPLLKDSLDCEILLCRSLDEMLTLPALKRESWLSLRSIEHQQS